MIQALNKQRRLITSSTFPVGSIVMVVDPHRANKFEAKYLGPYTVKRRTRNGNYVLQDETGDELERRLPPDQMKLVSKKPRDIDLQNNVYEVERIENHRGSAGNYEYLTKWKNYREKTWEPQENFKDTALISDYWKNKSS
jgi:hypothetical protein